jgi:hypothetical protein
VVGQRDLCVERSAKRLLRASESDEHRIAGATEIVTLVPGKRVTQQRAMLIEHCAITFRTQLRQMLGRTFDVAEQERDGARGSHSQIGRGVRARPTSSKNAKGEARRSANQGRSAGRNDGSALLYCRAFGRPLRPGRHR